MARILLIDDDDLLRRSLRLGLSRVGHTVVLVTNGKEAMESLSGDPPDLILTDVVMPEMDGMEVIMEVRHRFPNLPIIAMSGGGSVDSECYLNMARQLGSRKVLRKPFSMPELIDAINALLGPS